MKKFFAWVIVVVFIAGMLLATASTFAHAGHKTFWIERTDDQGNPYWYPDYIAQDNHDRSHARQQHENRRLKEHRHSRYDEQYYRNYDEWEYEQPRRRKLKFKPSFFLDIYLD